MNKKIEEKLRDEWQTPRALAKTLVDRYGLEVDVAASKSNKVCRRYISEAGNALSKDWDAPWFCNPPYSNILPWVKHALHQQTVGVMLLPARAESDWWCLASTKENVDFQIFRGRVYFDPPHPEIKKSSPRHASVLLVFNDDEPRFKEKGNGPFLPPLCPKTGNVL